MFYPMIGIADHLSKNQLRALAVSTHERSPDFPEVPTMAEAGFPGFERYTPGIGVLAPARTPEPIIERRNAALRAPSPSPTPTSA
jgi:tripartite-type tricarboxylate transporter receptor subunit TctC